jgi:hypothetical protein
MIIDRWYGERVADIFLSGSLRSLGLTQRIGDIATNRDQMVMRRCRKLVACCSTAISIILLFAGALTVEPDAIRTTRAVTHQLLMMLEPSTGKYFKSFIQQALFKTSGLDRVVTQRMSRTY